MLLFRFLSQARLLVFYGTRPITEQGQRQEERRETRHPHREIQQLVVPDRDGQDIPAQERHDAPPYGRGGREGRDPLTPLRGIVLREGGSRHGNEDGGRESMVETNHHQLPPHTDE